MNYSIVEGCYAARPELSYYFDLTVFVHTSANQRRKRQRERGAASQAWLDRWEATETHYIMKTQLPARTNVVVKGD